MFNIYGSLYPNPMSSQRANTEGESHQRIAYPLAAQRWLGQGSAVVLDGSGSQLLAFSIEFLVAGKVDTFAFVLHCLSMTYVTVDGYLCNEEGTRQDPGSRISAGRFIYHSSGESEYF